MGIHGVFKDIGPGERISLAKLSANHYRQHNRPFRLAVDISIWLFQIQSGKGGSNPALRTFYYRLLRLLTLNIHPLFVFDGLNKPLFKRNKKVGGPGVRVASVPEFLAKQLLKQFGFPWHIAPGEAEAECALLQREDIVDAVLSEDVDTLMFGSGVTLRNWTSEGTSAKTPTHVNVYRSEETLAKSGMNGEGMVLVALMSGGDYIPEGIPGCGPKLACDAARAGFGKELCALRRSDKEGLRAWRERLQHEIRTNESKFFSRKNKTLTIPDDFPSAEVMGYYTRPCISSAQKLDQLRASLKWDQDIDYPALRSFTGDAFDWRCKGGAKKFIRNLAPAILVRRLRLVAEADETLAQEAQAALESSLIAKIHGQRNHSTTDGELEYRVSFTPSNLVPIDLDIEEEEDDFLEAGRDDDDSAPEEDLPAAPSETPTEASDAEGAPASPTKKKRQARPYDPDAAEKLWIIKDFLQMGCPLLVEDYEAGLRNPREAIRRKAAAASTNIHAPPKPRARATKAKAAKSNDMPANALMRHARVTKSATVDSAAPAEKDQDADVEPEKATTTTTTTSGFKLPTSRLPNSVLRRPSLDALPMDPLPKSTQRREDTTRQQQHTPKKPKTLKRPSADFSTPRAARGRADITSYFSPTPRAKRTQSQGDEVVGKPSSTTANIINLISSSPMQEAPDLASAIRDTSPTPRRGERLEDDLPPLPGTVTKRRKIRRGPLRKSLSAPVGISSPLFVQRESRPHLEMQTDGLDERDDVRGDFMNHEPPVSAQRQRRSNTPPIRNTDLHKAAADLDFPSSNSLPTPPAEKDDEEELPSSPVRAIAMPATTDPNTRKRLKPATPPPTFTNPAAAVAAAEIISLSSPPTQQPQTLTLPTSEAPKQNPPSKPPTKKKTHIILRSSLPGTWRSATAEEAEALDLTGDGSGVRADFSGARGNKGMKSGRDGKKSKWRASGVEVLDLTED
ncbi:hypothetical protein Q7P37_005528 [Cladosporium fusiforme]